MTQQREMTMLDVIQRLWSHAAWADGLMSSALVSADLPEPAAAEFGHLLGADEVWLSRLEGRPPALAVWPKLTAEQLRSSVEAIHAGYGRYLKTLDEARLSALNRYTNSAGREFTTPIGEILLHVPMHAQYHRGKVNLLLRQARLEPAPVDYIAFVRGAPAARTPR
jgi:uncharacterized damage-inducible protein DinB